MTVPAPSPAASSPSGGPDTVAVFSAVYGLLLRSIATRGRLIGVGALAAISVFTAVVVSNTSSDDPTMTALDFVNGNLSTLLPVAVLIFGVATIGDLIDDGSLVYLWLRPVRSWIHVAAAVAATLTVVVPLVGLPILVSTSLIDTDSDLLTATVVASLVAMVAYSTLFVVAGIRLRRPLPWGLVYILIWEGFVASAGETAAKLALRGYVRSILSEITQVKIDLADVNLASGILVPLAAAAVLLAYGSHRLANTDVA